MIGDEFLSQYPQDKKAPEVLFQMAYLRYLHHDNKLAYQSFWKLVQKYPAHTTATYAGLLLLDILNQKSDYSNMIAACKKLLSTSQLTQEKFKGEVSDILRKSELQQIAALEADKQYEAAGKAYLAYDQKYGSQDLALKEKALFNAAACFSQAGDSEKALGTREAFLKQFPQSKLRADLLLQVAKSYEAITDFAKAAHYFELFHREYPQHAQSQESLRLAGFYFWGSGQRDRAEQTFGISKKIPRLQRHHQQRSTRIL
ncbi:outer membrane protein assembly factor BamD [bacterium]|nr:outer membrane protein assembly factor BamD [bacterium]